MRVLLLGGTGEARELARLLVADGIEVISSLAGRTTAARRPAGELRVGGFGGVAGLITWLQTNPVDVVVDATHPFATQITTNATAATAHLNLPFLILNRPAWTPEDATTPPPAPPAWTPEDATTPPPAPPTWTSDTTALSTRLPDTPAPPTCPPGDTSAPPTWYWVDSPAAAAELLPRVGSRVFLTIGRQGLDAFATTGLWTLARCVDPPEPPPTWCQLLLARGPFSESTELELLQRHRIDVLVTKNSGGPATAPKLSAARQLHIPVIIIRRPPLPDGPNVVTSPAEALTWLKVSGYSEQATRQARDAPHRSASQAPAGTPAAHWPPASDPPHPPPRASGPS
ncbi:precorrin-6A/cobalt-precorrin-6A reductase [Kribbella aluminosa]|uniref:Precorrin-6A/cobalt-precorrin-6A reductase n=1 Tax=Kribbella aluminosa TaxID=416017 RepID=A0ABS4UGH1_9ACTN|nr:precorrin-6A/cobalt-precorrin-6A reductase [Kribbella aluminosa]MBP2350715.1 precorrin-6A/cobalt-precorrin-6A reductase [Kribbella aluminosa]